VAISPHFRVACLTNQISSMHGISGRMQRVNKFPLFVEGVIVE